VAVADQEISMFQKIWSLGNYHKLANEHQSISEHLVCEAVVRAGQKVLDLGAGSGNTTLAAAPDFYFFQRPRLPAVLGGSLP
jgi:cyclopropane fatty-acyl-phospholipid synthase-like methyltransferase